MAEGPEQSEIADHGIPAEVPAAVDAPDAPGPAARTALEEEHAGGSADSAEPTDPPEADDIEATLAQVEKLVGDLTEHEPEESAPEQPESEAVAEGEASAPVEAAAEEAASRDEGPDEPSATVAAPEAAPELLVAKPDTSAEDEGSEPVDSGPADPTPGPAGSAGGSPSAIGTGEAEGAISAESVEAEEPALEDRMLNYISTDPSVLLDELETDLSLDADDLIAGDQDLEREVPSARSSTSEEESAEKEGAEDASAPEVAAGTDGRPEGTPDVASKEPAGSAAADAPEPEASVADPAPPPAEDDPGEESNDSASFDGLLSAEDLDAALAEAAENVEDNDLGMADAVDHSIDSEVEIASSAELSPTELKDEPGTEEEPVGAGSDHETDHDLPASGADEPTASPGGAGTSAHDHVAEEEERNDEGSKSSPAAAKPAAAAAKSTDGAGLRGDRADDKEEAVDDPNAQTAPGGGWANALPRSGVQAAAMACRGLSVLNYPLRRLDPSFRTAIDWIAVTLVFWVPIVWLLVWFSSG